MKIADTAIAGCFEITPEIRSDDRGTFVKYFQRSEFSERGLITEFAEEYHSFSVRNVVRGLHFQSPPHSHIKMVLCLTGTIFDAVVDLRVGSPTYGRHFSTELSASNAKVLYIPEGLAHGYSVCSESAVVLYKVTSAYAPAHDKGIRWNSAGIAWENSTPITSERDQKLPALSDFVSPFLFRI